MMTGGRSSRAAVYASCAQVHVSSFSLFKKITPDAHSTSAPGAGGINGFDDRLDAIFGSLASEPAKAAIAPSPRGIGGHASVMELPAVPVQAAVPPLKTAADGQIKRSGVREVYQPPSRRGGEAPSDATQQSLDPRQQLSGRGMKRAHGDQGEQAAGGAITVDVGHDYRREGDSTAAVDLVAVHCLIADRAKVRPPTACTWHPTPATAIHALQMLHRTILRLQLHSPRCIKYLLCARCDLRLRRRGGYVTTRHPISSANSSAFSASRSEGPPGHCRRCCRRRCRCRRGSPRV